MATKKMYKTKRREKLHTNIDKFGTAISIACAVHCIALPFLIATLPLIGLSFLLDATAERIFILASICLAAFSLCWGFTIHKRVQALLVFATASIMIISAVFILPHNPHDVEGDHDEHPVMASVPLISHFEHGRTAHPLGIILMITGGGAIAFSHLLNRHFCKSCRNCRQHRHR